jgi:flagellum-specific ATP synthase
MRIERTSFGKRLAGYNEVIDLPAQPIVEGRLLRMVGLTLEAEGLRAPVGSRCLVINDDSYHPVQVEAEVMGFSGSKIYLMPVGSLSGIAPGARVVPLPDTGRLPMGMSMLGRVLDGAGRALDGKGGMKAEDWVPMDGPPSTSRWMWASAPSTRCSPSVAASASACSPAPASARACSWG